MRQFAGSFANSTTTSVFDRIRFTSEDGGQCLMVDAINISYRTAGSGSGSGFILL